MTQARRLRQYRMKFERIPDGQAAVDPKELGSRSKLGGDPDWEQGDEWPDCSDCGTRMTFIAQLDSIEHDEDGNPHRMDAIHGDQHFMFGDVGMLYIFLCENCNESRSVMQCG
jgi:uncharacterized protein YwqG